MAGPPVLLLRAGGEDRRQPRREGRPHRPAAADRADDRAQLRDRARRPLHDLPHRHRRPPLRQGRSAAAHAPADPRPQVRDLRLHHLPRRPGPRGRGEVGPRGRRGLAVADAAEGGHPGQLRAVPRRGRLAPRAARPRGAPALLRARLLHLPHDRGTQLRLDRPRADRRRPQASHHVRQEQGREPARHQPQLDHAAARARRGAGDGPLGLPEVPAGRADQPGAPGAVPIGAAAAARVAAPGADRRSAARDRRRGARAGEEGRGAPAEGRLPVLPQARRPRRPRRARARVHVPAARPRLGPEALQGPEERRARVADAALPAPRRDLRVPHRVPADPPGPPAAGRAGAAVRRSCAPAATGRRDRATVRSPPTSSPRPATSRRPPS